MSKAEDKGLWEAYARAVASGDANAVSEAGSDILAWHKPFFVQYAAKSAFRQWDTETRRDYLAEIMAIAAVKLPLYNRDAVHASGRTASFITFVKPYLRMARYKVEGSRRPVRVGHETVRLSAAATQYVSKRQSAGAPQPDAKEIAEHLTDLFGKRVTAERVPKLLALPYSTQFETVDSEGQSYIPTEVQAAMPVNTRPADPADIVADEDEKRQVSGKVHAALDAMNLTDLESAIVTDRLMSDEPDTVEAIAIRFGITEMEVVDVEQLISTKLRQTLARAFQR